MILNLVSNLGEGYNPDLILQYNTSIAVNLKKFLEKAGHDVNLVKDHDNTAPEADHSIVISNWAMNKIKANHGYRRMLREVSRGKVALWLDAAFGGMDELYDVVLTVTPPYEASAPKFKWVGYAADPEVFYPQPGSEPTAFVDSYAFGWYNAEYDYVYDIIKEVLEDIELKIIQPVTQYNTGKRVPWTQYAALFRQCQFSVVTQLGGWGLTNIETATCGALLVMNKAMDRPLSWPCKMNHAFWETKEELKDILGRDVDLKANRAVALESSWGDVVNRVEEALR